MKECRFERWK